MLFLSKLGGADRPAEIADWVKFRFVELKSLLNARLEKKSATPITWKRILENAMEAEEIERVFVEYLLLMTEDEKRLWNLDGKVVCSVKAEETEKQLHLLALQESEVNLTIAQTALQAGENEISAGKRLLKKVDLTGKIVSGDAIFAQNRVIENSH